MMGTRKIFAIVVAVILVLAGIVFYSTQHKIKKEKVISGKVGIVVSSDTSYIYGGGAYPLDVIAAARMFEYMGMKVEMIDISDIISTNLSSFDIIYFGGGNAYYWKLEDRYINFTAHIREYVREGGNYIGVCAGAYFASSNVVWEGASYPYPLRLFEGYALGPIRDISDYPEPWRLTKIRIVDKNMGEYYGKNFTVMYYWGPYFKVVSDKSNVSTVAVYDYGGYANNTAAMIKFSYGMGKVFLSGVHPEFEESANISGDRDWCYSDDFYWNGTPMVDPDSEWPLMKKVVKWMLPHKVMYKEELNEKDEFKRTAGVYAGLGASSRTVYATMKMLKYAGLEPIAWDDYSRNRLNIFNFVVFPNGNSSVMKYHINISAMNSFISRGGNIIGIGGGATLVWKYLGYSQDGLKSHFFDYSTSTGGLLVNVTVENSYCEKNDTYRVSLWLGNTIKYTSHWDLWVRYDPIYWAGSQKYAFSYLTDMGKENFAMVIYRNPLTQKSIIFLSSVDPSTEENQSLIRDSTEWDNGYNDPDSEWDLMSCIINTMEKLEEKS